MKILVLSNDEMERTVIRQVVQHNGHELLTAGDSEEALQTLRESGARFVIVDRSTTDAGEKQFIQRLRNARPPRHIYVLLIASKSQDVDITTPRGGADDYLHKPIVPLELKSRVHLGQRLLGLGDNLVNARDALEKSAMFDPLTKTLNEMAFLALSRADLERARRAQAPLSLLAIEVVNLSEILEKHGQEIVNDAFVLIAQMIREKSRLYDSVGRHGDDLFLIPLPGVIGQDAEKVANRIAKGIAGTSISTLDGTPVDIQLSIGIVSATRITATTEIELMIEKAREAAARGDEQIQTVFI